MGQQLSLIHIRDGSVHARRPPETQALGNIGSGQVQALSLSLGKMLE